MRIGIIFPVVIFITAVVFLAWFLLAAMLPGSIKMKKQRLL
ncbi:YoaK family small membrane protein [Escherichia coli]